MAAAWLAFSLFTVGLANQAQPPGEEEPPASEPASSTPLTPHDRPRAAPQAEDAETDSLPAARISVDDLAGGIRTALYIAGGLLAAWLFLLWLSHAQRNRRLQAEAPLPEPPQPTPKKNNPPRPTENLPGRAFERRPPPPPKPKKEENWDENWDW